MLKSISSTVGCLAVAMMALAAPGPKAKEVKLGPITDEQLATAHNNLHQIALAWHNYESANANLPNNQSNAKGKVLLSWRVQILPYIEQDTLYRQFKLDEPWDSENNKKLIDKMPKLYAPVRAKADGGMTFYQSSTGKHGLLKPGKILGFANIPDGTSNTFMVVESAKPVIWTKPVDLECDGKKLPELGGLFDGKFHAAMGDGSVMRFRKGIDADLLLRLFDPSDGNVIDLRGALDKE